jgi:hypothetical protein
MPASAAPPSAGSRAGRTQAAPDRPAGARATAPAPLAAARPPTRDRPRRAARARRTAGAQTGPHRAAQARRSLGQDLRLQLKWLARSTASPEHPSRGQCGVRRQHRMGLRRDRRKRRRARANRSRRGRERPPPLPPGQATAGNDQQLNAKRSPQPIPRSADRTGRHSTDDASPAEKRRRSMHPAPGRIRQSPRVAAHD